MAGLDVTLFGGFEIRLADGAARKLPGQKDRGLLAVLALPPDATHSRDKLTGLLWSDRADTHARDSLKHALTRLRKCLASVDATPIIADRQFVRLDPAAISIDVVAFERLLEDGSPVAVEQAMALYRGDLLDGISVRDPAFEDWLLVERQRLRHLVEEAAANLMRTSLASGALDSADAAARRLLSLDPLREEACRALMQIYSDRGETAQALKLYDALRERLRSELGIKPEPETSQLYETIRQRNDVPVTTAADPVHGGEGAPEFAPLPLPEKPSIAVLPLDNMSHDPDQDFLGEGISEDIITALSKFRSLFVIARNSSFSFKGQQLEIREIGKRLGVRYVVEGSVRRVDNRVRISAQLIDAVEDKNIWAERYDRELEDIFAVQDEVTLSIVQAIEPHLTSAEQQRALRKPPENLDAWENYQRGMWHLLTYQPAECESAISYLKRAVALDPGFARARACLGFAYGARVLHDISPDRDADIERALAAGREAAKIDEYEAFAYLTTARTRIFQGRHDEAIAATDRAIQVNPNFALAHMIRGHALWHAGKPQDAMEAIDTAIRASPHDPLMWVFFASKAIALVMLERFDEAISVSKAAQQHPNAAIYAHLGEMSALGHKGDTDAAADAVKRAKIVKPDVSVSFVDKVLPVADPRCRELFVGGLRKAGLP